MHVVTTHTHTHPLLGGTNIPALNRLLSVWGMALSGEVLEGEFELADHKISYASGTSIARWPKEGVVIARDLNDQGKEKCKRNDYSLTYVTPVHVWVISVLNQQKRQLSQRNA